MLAVGWQGGTTIIILLLGTEALRLWVDHLFEVSDKHKLGLDTWSFNPRMIHVAEKVGFVYEGRQREMRHWQGKWLDLLHFSILREEWQGLKDRGTIPFDC